MTLKKIISRLSRKPIEISSEEEIGRAIRAAVTPSEPVQIVTRDPSYRVIESYYVYKPFVKVTIAETEEGPHYFVEEYGLTPEDKQVLERLTEILMDEIKPPTKPEDVKDLRGYVFRETERVVEKYREKLGLVGGRRLKLLYYIERNLLGYGPIDPLMRDGNIEDISCNGVGIPVYVWHRKYESIPTNITFVDEDYLNEFVMKMTHMAGKHISIAFPIVDAMLPEKHRLAATFGREVSVKGPTFTIRKFREKPFSVTELIKFGTINSLIAAYLWTMIEHMKTAMIAGGTGTGKTTLLNVISLFIKPGMKIVTVEDTPELNLSHNNWVQLTTRETYLIGSRETGTNIRLFDLVKLSLRYRPDYIIVGEVRGEEAFVLFQALASVGYNTPILIKDNSGNIYLVKIGEFVDKFYSKGEERIAKPVYGYYVLSHDEYGVVWKPVIYVLRHSVDEIYEITYQGGGRIEATGSHSIFVLDPDTLEIIEKPVSMLDKGEYLVSFVSNNRQDQNITINAVKYLIDLDDILVDHMSEDDKRIFNRNPVPLQEYLTVKHTITNAVLRQRRSKYVLPPKILLDKELAFIFGAYLADGCIKNHRGKRICFTFGKNEKHIAEKIITIFEKKFGVKPVIDDRDTYTIYEYPVTILAHLFEKLLGRDLYSKRIPMELWISPSNIVKAFFEGFKADARRTLRRRYTCYTTANYELALQLLWLARFKGFYSILVKEKGTGKNKGKEYYNVLVYLDKNYTNPNAHEKIPVKPLIRLIEMTKPRSMPYKYTYIFRREFISRSKAHEIIKWIKQRGIFDDTSREYLQKLEKLLDSELIIVKVKDIKKKPYKGYVYDISVPNTESFFGGEIPILLHNTGHGGLSTIHAETLDYAIKRLTSPPMNIPPTYMKLMNVFMHLSRVITRVEKGVVKVQRRISIVQEVVDANKYATIAEWDPRTDNYKVDFNNSIHLKDIAVKRGWDLEDVIEEIYRKATVLNWMIYRNITDVWDVSRIIFNYYYDPLTVYKRAVEELEKAEKRPEELVVERPPEAVIVEETGETKELGEATRELFERTRELGK